MSERTKEIVTALWLLLIVLVIALASSVANGQNIEGQIIASQYGVWQVSGYAPDTYTGFAPTACRVQGGSSFFPAFDVGTPIMIVDGNPSLTEVVTPTNVVVNNNACAIAISPVNHHNLPFYLTSATGGLQEAINANYANPASNTIVLDNRFYQAVGPANVAAIINAAAGRSNLGLVDITQTPYVWYTWNGSQYVVSEGYPVNSVFGRVGSVVAQTGDYDCAQVTGCLTSAPVTSVFGRVGAVTAQTGDYTCLQVTNCGPPPNAILTTTLSANITSLQTTIPLTSVAGLTTTGEIIIGSEWITYTGLSSNSLTGAGRGNHATTASSASSGTNVFSVLVDFSNPSQAVSNAIVSNGGSSLTLPFFGCAMPDQGDNVLIQFGCPGSSETFLDSAGAIKQTIGDDENIFESEAGIGPGGGLAPIVNSGYLFDSMRQNQSVAAQGFGAGLAGPVESIQPPTAAAPNIVNLASPSGSTTWSYECTGTDVDGNTFPGTVASITNGPTTITSGEIVIGCPFSAGAASQQIWRTAGGPDQGLIYSSTPQPISFPDNGAASSGGVPPGSNSSIPKVCTGGEQYCQLSGTTSTPTVACASGTQGWTFHNVSATVSPFAYVCDGTNWVTAY